jgi:hypothetical protein
MRNVDQLKTAPCNFIFLREKYASDIFHPTTSFFTRPCFAHDLIVFFFFAPLLRMIFFQLAAQGVDQHLLTVGTPKVNTSTSLVIFLQMGCFSFLLLHFPNVLVRASADCTIV